MQSALDVKITAGTNSGEEKAALLQRLHLLLLDTFGEMAEASYIGIHELPAESWGYAGMSQASRAGVKFSTSSLHWRTDT